MVCQKGVPLLFHILLLIFNHFFCKIARKLSKIFKSCLNLSYSLLSGILAAIIVPLAALPALEGWGFWDGVAFQEMIYDRATENDNILSGFLWIMLWILNFGMSFANPVQMVLTWTGREIFLVDYIMTHWFWVLLMPPLLGVVFVCIMFDRRNRLWLFTKMLLAIIVCALYLVSLVAAVAVSGGIGFIVIGLLSTLGGAGGMVLVMFSDGSSTFVYT